MPRGAYASPTVRIVAPEPTGGAGFGTGVSILTVGDAYAPRGIEQAILDGRLAVAPV